MITPLKNLCRRRDRFRSWKSLVPKSSRLPPSDPGSVLCDSHAFARSDCTFSFQYGGGGTFSASGNAMKLNATLSSPLFGTEGFIDVQRQTNTFGCGTVGDGREIQDTKEEACFVLDVLDTCSNCRSRRQLCNFKAYVRHHSDHYLIYLCY
jgi:hypothetical protein